MRWIPIYSVIDEQQTGHLATMSGDYDFTQPKSRQKSSKIFSDLGLSEPVAAELVSSVHWVTSLQRHILDFFARNSKVFGTIVTVLFYVGYFVYLGFAVAYSIDLATPLLIITAFILFIKGYAYIRDHYGDVISDKCCLPVNTFIDNNWFYLKWSV